MTTSNLYEHNHHAAGNHGDVFKHTVLVAILKMMQETHPKGIRLVDTHSGEGVHDLSLHQQGQGQGQDAEYKRGLIKVMQHKNDACCPKPVQDYIKVAQGWSMDPSHVEYYAGSPVIGQKLLRPQDEHVLSDLHIVGMEGLKENQSSFEQLDAFDPDSLDYFLGGTDKHCVVLIDPPYVDNDDYGRAKNLMDRILDKRPSTTVLVWVPFIHGSRYRFSALKMLKETASAKATIGQYTATVSVGGPKLMGSAMFVANPEAGFDDIIGDDCLDWLSRTMTYGKGEYSVEQKMKKKRPVS